MRKVIGPLVAAVIAVSAGTALADLYPEKLSFTIYAFGKQIGKSEVEIEETADAIIVTGRNVVDSGDFKQDIRSKTFVDAKTKLIRSYSFEGTKMDEAVGGEVVVDEGTVTGKILYNGERITLTEAPEHQPVIIFGDYIIEHEIFLLLAHTLQESYKEPRTYGLVFPATFTDAPVTIAHSSETIIESETSEAYCDKYQVGIKGSQPFVSFWDPERKLPLYVAFPGTNTELFLDQFFGDEPISRYR